MWKYRVVTLQASTDEAIQNTINDFGKQGWELVAVTDNVGWIRFFFKKQGS